MNIRSIVVAGAGTMGSSMAQIFAKYHDSVVIYNHREVTLQKAQKRIQENVQTLVQAGEMTQADAEHVLGALSYTTDWDCFSSCDLVVENLAEDLSIKQAFYEKVSQLVREDAIIATNTSGLSINTLAQSVQGAHRFIGMHWFNPPHLIPLIEIIKGDATDDEVAQAIYQLSLKIDKKPVIVNRDVAGFAANRLQFAILREALDLVQKGVISKEGIDDVMKYGLGFRYACLGPLEVSDFGGLDTFYHISSYLMKDLCDSKEVPELMKQHYEAGEYGVKNGAGFYDYSGEKAQQATQARDEKFLKLYHALYE